MTKLTMLEVAALTTEELNEKLKSKKMLKLGPDNDDPSKWSIWGGPAGDKPEYMEMVDRESFDDLRAVMEPIHEFMRFHHEFLLESDLSGAFGVFLKAKMGDM